MFLDIFFHSVKYSIFLFSDISLQHSKFLLFSASQFSSYSLQENANSVNIFPSHINKF